MKKISIALAAFILFAIFQPAYIFAVMPVDKIISFTSRTMSGETINIDSVIQKKPVLLFFWASW